MKGKGKVREEVGGENWEKGGSERNEGEEGRWGREKEERGMGGRGKQKI